MRKLIFLLVLIAPAASAQVFNAVSCSVADINAALNSVTVANPVTATINVPAGTCTWSAGQQINWSTPSANTTITIQGQSSIATTNSDGNPATFNDATIIIDNTGACGGCSLAHSMTWTISGVNAYARFTGFTVEWNSSSASDSNCSIFWQGNTNSLRVDHNHFWFNGGPSGGSCAGIIYPAVNGVFDHNYFQIPEYGGRNNGIRMSNGATAYGDTSGQGNNSWSSPTALGTAAFMFFENNTFSDSVSNDCDHAGRQVFRYNTFNNSSVQSHEMEGDARGCRATEVYNNHFVGNTMDPNNSFVTTGFRSGTGMVWGNTVTNYPNLILLGNDRVNGHPFNTPPNGFGYCGSISPPPTGPSNWDGNSSSNGYPCIDQAGRGQSDQLTGSFPTKCNATTGCTTYNGNWPENKLEPLYEWLNVYTPGVIWDNNDSTTTFAANRDYYSASSGTSNPGTCTAGPGGTYGVSPTGSYGQGFWRTDISTLEICTATNTWTAVYMPYIYPHPLDTTAGATSPPTITPSSGTESGSVTVTITANTAGATSCYTTDSSTPTGNGAGTCTHGTTYSSPFASGVPPVTVKSISTKSGLTDSTVTSVTYTPPPSTTPIAPANGQFLSSNVSPAVTLSWSESDPSATKFNVYRNGSKIATTAVPSYKDASVLPGQSYSYAVSAVNSAGESIKTPVSGLSIPSPATQEFTFNIGQQVCNCTFTGLSITDCVCQ